MHQLAALIWKSYKLRLRSYYTTIIDLAGPVVVILLYICLKVALNLSHGPQVDDNMKQAQYFHSPAKDQINLKQDIRLRMCQKVLYHSSVADDDAFSSYLSNECGLQLYRVSSRGELVRQLKKSLDSRVAYQRAMTDLNRPNSTADNCIRLPSNENNSTSSAVIYQIGLERASLDSIEIHMTDSAGSSVIHVPYTQGSSYNEYKLPHSDLNLGSHLIEICSTNAFRQSMGPRPNATTTTTTPSTAPTATATATTTTTLTTTTAATTTGSNAANATLTPIPIQTRTSSLFDTTTTPTPIGTGTPASVASTTIESPSKQRAVVGSLPRLDDIKWSIRPYPSTTGVFLLPIATVILILIASLGTVIAMVYRIADANEQGIHRYSRLLGIPSGFYFLSEFLVSSVISFVQSLVIAVLLGIPTGEYPYDPIASSSMTLKWMLLFTYSLSITSHSIFWASLFSKSSYALLTLSAVATAYVMFPLLLILQWTPYGFRPFKALVWSLLLIPSSNFEAICIVMISVTMQKNEIFGWSHLSERIVNGGFTDLSVAELWAILVGQTILWLLVPIIIDQYNLSTTKNLRGFVISQLNELFCCNSLGDPKQLGSGYRTKTKTANSTVKSLVSGKDPNRICCSLRHVEVTGPTRLLPYTKGNPLKLSHDQLQAMKQAERDGLSKSAQYLVNRKQTGSSNRQKDEPILLDDAIRQHIVWYKTLVKFNKIDLDFRFNQVTFILGQTAMKELLFETLLGLCALDSGNIIIDQAKYSAHNISLARREIGYLSERDVFHSELSIFENLQLFGSLREPSYKSFDSESLYVLSLLHLTHRRDDSPASLTHRSARKLALAVALVGYTKLLLLTEPTLNLRWRPRCQVYNLLRKYKSIRSIVVDTSDIDEAVAFGDRVVLLKDGVADLNGTPKRLTKRLNCGYWLVFKPTTGGAGRAIKPEAIKALERLTHEIFKQDKINLDQSKRSVYQDTGKSRSVAEPMKSPGSPQNQSKLSAAKIAKVSTDLHRAIVVVKIHHTNQSERGLCSLLKMYANEDVHGFHLAQLDYESLEDILVSRMSRAIYPDLPPDLLLSLQHRTQVDHKTHKSMPISVRRLSATLQAQHSVRKTIFDSNILAIIKDRFNDRSEMILMFVALFGSLLVMTATLLSLRYSLKSEDKHSSFEHAEVATRNDTNNLILQRAMIDRLYKYRIGFYILEREQISKNSLTDGGSGGETTFNGYNLNVSNNPLLAAWPGNRNLLGVIKLYSINNKTDAQIVATLVDKSKDIAGSLIIHDPRSSETIVVYEPQLPHMLLASIRAFMNFALSSGKKQVAKFEKQQQGNLSLSSSLHSDTKTGRAPISGGNNDERRMHFKTSLHNFHQPWHEMIQGFPSRRLIYGIGFAIAEAISMGALVMAPIRHRNESRSVDIQMGYWLKMAIVDLSFSLLNIAGYLILFITIEGVTSSNLIASILLVMLIYKIASLPIPYLFSMVAESSYYAFISLGILYFTVAWNIAIFIKSYVDWTLISNSYTYTMITWIFFSIPITGLIESLVVINQMNNIENRCRDVPAFVPTRNTVELDGVYKNTVLDSLLEKVRECLASGKTSVETDVLHGRSLGILWYMYLMLLFGFIIWSFLLTCERLFGLIARKTTYSRTSSDPMKTIVRVPDSSSSRFAWGKERDRLVSEYIRCINEPKYANLMEKHCLIVRIWLKPFDDQITTGGRISTILDPLMSLGYTKNDVLIELRTTLQMFIRLGDEAKPCRVSKINLIETYSKYAAAHGDLIAKFAVVDWTRENFYKILLHGYYNNKSEL